MTRTITTWATNWTTAGQAPAAIVTSGPCAQMYIRDRTVLTAGTGWYWLLEGYTPIEAAFMAVTTVTTVGYGETHPLDTAGLA